jgi:beta-xylosidase
MKKIFWLLLLTSLPLSAAFAQATGGKYHNPIIPTSLPDPSVIRAGDGYFYLFATEDIRNMPIYRSHDLTDWQFVGTAFTDQTRPQWNRKGNLWAPDINFTDGHYVLYYAKSEWGGEWTCGVGVATADHPQGPFTDHGALFISKDIGVQNSIDPFFIEDGGHKYVFWGSFHGIFGIELTADGLHVKPGEKPRQVAGTFMEATYIHKRGDYYYLFGSAGTCCEGARSTYRVTYGRSRNLFGPYVDKQGRALLDNHFDVLIHKSDSVVGPGHNAEFVMDNEGADWIIYHGFSVQDPDAGRQVYMDRVDWVDDWPVVKADQPSVESDKPALSQLYLADPTIFVDGGTYYLYGTSPHSDTGFWVYTSTDLKNWNGPAGKVDGYALCGGTFGTAGFWAPQVFKHDGRYYMAYTANEQIAVATADSPLGPFRQDKPAMIPAQTKEIDPFVFFDTDGKAYLYHVRLQKGNRIFVSELNGDLLSVKEETTRECITAIPGSWEDTVRAPWTVTEGPTVTKIGSTYYLFYSCNDFRNINYAVGYATAKSPLGPWKKQKKPLISRDLLGENGTGHGDLFRNAQGQWQYVFHTHHSNSEVGARRTALITLKMQGNRFIADKDSFRYLSR